MKERTKIYFTIVGLLALTGVFYAANPAPFASNQPLASNYNPTLALNFASGDQPGGFQPLQVDANFSWVGGTVAGWNSPGNWSPLGPPGVGDTALFDGAFINQPNLTTGATVGALHMATGVIQDVTLSANPGAVLNISALSLLGTGILVDNTNAVTLTITASLGVNNSQAWTNNSGNLFTVSAANISLGGNAVTVNGTGNALISGIISGLGSVSDLIKDGGGTLTLTATNTYSGGTTAIGGTLLVNNTSGSGTGTGAVTVSDNGTTLGGTGIISGPVTVFAGANIAPGNGGNNTGTLQTGALTLSPTANFRVDINGTTTGTFDQIQVNTGGVAILNSVLAVTVGTTLSVGQTFTILINNSADPITGTFAGIPEGGTVAGSNG
ncbi:MAG: autotransporter-associated beta strand repeat-containing protein, partial [Candidatus Udaeobacter sp.]